MGGLVDIMKEFIEKIKTGYLKYRPTDEDLKIIGLGDETYYEVWTGLPDVDFDETADRGGSKAMRFDKDGNYIWVSADALVAYQADHKAIYIASVKVRQKEGIRVWSLTNYGDLEEAVEKARGFNTEKINIGRGKLASLENKRRNEEYRKQRELEDKLEEARLKKDELRRRKFRY